VDRRVGTLDGTGTDRRLVESPGSPGRRGRAGREGLPEKDEGRFEALARRLVGNAEGDEGLRCRPPADADIDAPAALVVELADLLGQKQRMMQRQDEDRGADPQPLGPGEDRRGQQVGRGLGDPRLVEVEFVEPDAVETEAVSLLEDGE
jgi:hypothetical protein